MKGVLCAGCECSFDRTNTRVRFHPQNTRGHDRECSFDRTNMILPPSVRSMFDRTLAVMTASVRSMFDRTLAVRGASVVRSIEHSQDAHSRDARDLHNYAA